VIVLPSGTIYGPYPAELVEVKDGDTVVLSINHWPGHTVTISVREFGIDTPEKRTRDLNVKALGLLATLATRKFLTNKLITVDNIHYGKYAGRVLGSVYADGESLADHMMVGGFAQEYYGGQRPTWPKGDPP
jgi:micrococcal nuclease